MTVGFWVLAVFSLIVGVALAFAYWYCESVSGTIIAIFLTLVIVGGIIGGGHWYCGSTANGIRAMKDQQSNFDNGLNREITITAENGREIFYYKGKCDIEHNDGYILFETEDNKRMMIYYGVTDTIIIKEY